MDIEMSSKYDRTFICVCLYALLSHVYFVLRFSGNWIEEDTGRMTKFAQYVQEQSTIFPSGPVYPSGPGFSIILTTLSEMSNVSIVTLQQSILPIIGSFFIVVVYIAFLELTGSRKVALLSAFLLSVQPDFLLTTVRGTHEKFTYTLVALSMFFLSRSFSRRRNIKEFIYYVLLFYISALGMISYNFFFASTYIFAVTVAFIIGYLISETPQISTSLKRLTYSSATSTIFFFSYMFYLYPPSRHLLHMFDTLQEQMSAVFLATEQQVSQFTYIFNMWVSVKVWLFLTLFNWVIAPLSLAAWIYFVYRFFWKKQRLTSPMLLLLLFYLAFSIQLIITILADRAGVFNNLELRVFPVLMFFAVPLAAISMMNILKYQKLSETHRKAVKFFFVSLLLVFSVNSLLKATNDPLVSNKWWFYSTQEKEGVSWVEHNMQEKSIWASLDARLPAVFNVYSEPQNRDKIKFTGPENAEYWLISDIVIKRAVRVKSPLPDVSDKPIIYDSGNVRIYDSYNESYSISS